MKKHELAYVAGIFDGEGYCAVTSYKASKNGKRYPRIVATITNCHKGCLDHIRDTVGYGIVYRCSGTSKSLAVYRWQVTHLQAIKLLTAIRPFCIIKGERIDVLLRNPKVFCSVADSR